MEQAWTAQFSLKHHDSVLVYLLGFLSLSHPLASVSVTADEIPMHCTWGSHLIR